MQKIEKTLKNAQTTLQRRTNNSLRNTKKHPRFQQLSFYAYETFHGKRQYYPFITLVFSSTPFKSASHYLGVHVSLRWLIYSQRAINIWQNYFEVENFNYLFKTKSTGNHMKHEK